ncbi:MAG: 3-hydroxymyristoyl-ACP dehydratase [Paucimonas sp.]|jgi:predicted hotdog family 3-hydroxylacyl-ACP dehydratase|nr:3-hydroxymyristoyl-ACP dehydratase [Paucimonas sp.]
MRLNRDWIAARIPHQGSMCLLESVEEWNEQVLHAHAVSHRDPANPLRAQDQLAAVCGIEYAAQAMAVHGALIAGQNERPRAGYLASVRGTTMHVARLDDIVSDLDIAVQRVSGDAHTVLYEFQVAAGGKMLLEGRAAVVLNAGIPGA